MLPVKPSIPADQRRLLECYAALEAADKETLQGFAEFLAQRAGAGAAPQQQAGEQEPRPIPRPVEETVIAAIRRLSETYHMLEKDGLLDETSVLMSAHILQGRSAVKVIDDLEVLFEETYLRFTTKKD